MAACLECGKAQCAEHRRVAVYGEACSGDHRDARIAELTRDANEWRANARQYERERFEAVAYYSKQLAYEQMLHRETQRRLDDASHGRQDYARIASERASEMARAQKAEWALDEARAECSAWIRNSNDKAAEVNTLATDLDEARALVSKLAGVIQPCIVCCFAMARFGRYDAAFGVGAPMLCDQCAAHSLEDGEDWRACPPESFHVALRALAKEDGK